eukprot:scaffold434_cov186-Pinguiococcus_pyrenoidosus.AAC.123
MFCGWDTDLKSAECDVGSKRNSMERRPHHQSATPAQALSSPKTKPFDTEVHGAPDSTGGRGTSRAFSATYLLRRRLLKRFGARVRT